MPKALLLQLTYIVFALSAQVHAQPVETVDGRKKEYDQAIANGLTPEQATKTAEEAGNRVKEVIRVEGQPFRVIYVNGNVIGVKSKISFKTLRSSMILSDNSCTQAMGNRGELVVPTVIRSLIPYWIKHPTKKGQPVIDYDSSDKKEVVKTETAVISRMFTPRFDEYLNAVPEEAIDEQKVFNEAKAMRTDFGWMTCEGTCENMIPANVNKALYWDENFEVGNDQTRMFSSSKDPSFNQMSSRLQLVPLNIRGNHIVFGQPARTFGNLAAFLPPGVTYQVQLTFREKNLIVADDELCQMKFDMDFTRVFTGFVQATEVDKDISKVNVDHYPVYNFVEADTKILGLNNIFDKYNFESSSVRK